jgi:uncharacterized protein (TIGR03067 family)
MNQQVLVGVIAACLIAGHADDGPERQLLGTWILITLEDYGGTGGEIAKSSDAYFEMVVQKNEITIRKKMGDMKLSFRTNAGSEPLQIELTPLAGEEKGKHCLGIYRVSEKTLELCIGSPGMPRPTKFRADGKKGWYMMKFKRGGV